MDQIVTRFPPSPTGYLHIGGARTALFNWLLARSAQGRFVLRIEDTDQERSTQEMTDSILEAMTWLGLDWDEGPTFQSQRFEIYHQHIEGMLDKGRAYYCQCTPEEVEAMRSRAREKGEKPKYDGTCRDKNLGPGPGRVVRFKSPLEGETVFTDLLKGINRVDNRELDDFVVRRADRTPTYNLAVVVDDATMGVNTILRGDDHLSNTPKQVLLYQAMDYALPRFGHVPMILGPDKKKLSKRHGAMSVLEYRDMGYLPQALNNYLVRLGWSYGDREIFDLEELVALFSLQNLGKSACVFNPEKLRWVNSQHIKRSQPGDLALDLQARLERDGFAGLDKDYLARVVPLLQPRAETMREMAEMARIFVIPDHEIRYDPQLVEKFLPSDVRPHLERLGDRFRQLADFSQQSLEDEVRSYLQEQDLKFKTLAQPIRVALTGQKASPGLFETMEVLGQARVVNRLSRAVETQKTGFSFASGKAES
jgi:glutamyl-tRNA synthetase